MHINFPCNTTSVIQMTPDQLQALIASVRTSTLDAVSASTSSPPPPKYRATFHNCRASYNGLRDHDTVEGFITTITKFKDLNQISDVDALRDLSLLLLGPAAMWWQGARKEATSWNDALELLRSSFLPAKPASQIYAAIFETKQAEGIAIDEFVSEKRALLARLPEGRHDEETQIDMIFELLHVNYRKQIERKNVNSFRDLLEKGRYVQKGFGEVRGLSGDTNFGGERSSGGEKNFFGEQTEQGRRRSRRCTYCSYKGHSAERCRKKRADERRYF